MQNRSQSDAYDTPLSRIIFQSLAKKDGQKMRFDEFMDLALYHPQHGYYASTIGTKIGREGDFFTSVSVGDTFGLILSYAIERAWNRLPLETGTPPVIVEQGAHDGQLALDILRAFRERNPDFLNQLKYCLVERKNRRELVPELEEFQDQICQVTSLDKVRERSGIFLANELLDAFPVRRFILHSGEWREQCVGSDQDGENLDWVTAAVYADSDPGFCEFLGLIGNESELPEGYTTEFCPGIKTWVDRASRIFQDSGIWWIIDYGHESTDYFAPARTDGTLRCFNRHRVHDSPLFRPGETDLTADVNFTHLEIEAKRSGLKISPLRDQARFLTEAGRDWLLGLEGEPGKEARRLRQFQTLTHPGMMGNRFRVAELGKNETYWLDARTFC